jgi:hypothetical protein
MQSHKIVIIAEYEPRRSTPGMMMGYHIKEEWHCPVAAAAGTFGAPSRTITIWEMQDLNCNIVSSTIVQLVKFLCLRLRHVWTSSAIEYPSFGFARTSNSVKMSRLRCPSSASCCHSDKIVVRIVTSLAKLNRISKRGEEKHGDWANSVCVRSCSVQTSMFEGIV